MKKPSWFLMSFSLIFFAIFLIFPLMNIVKKSFFHEGAFTLRFLGILFQGSLWRSAIIHSLLIALYTTLGSVLLCLPLGFLQARYSYRGKALFSLLLLAPMIMPPFVGTLGLLKCLSRWGTVNSLLLSWGWMNEPVDWFADENLLPMTVILEILHFYPMMLLNLTASFSGIDPSLEEAAALHGAKKWKQLKDIVWPLCRPGLLAGSSLVFILALTDLSTPLLVGFHETIPAKIFSMVTDPQENPVGYVMIFLLILASLGFFYLGEFTLHRHPQSLTKGRRVAHVVPLKKRAYPLVYLGTLTLIFIALIPHAFVVLYSLSGEWFLTPWPESYTGEYFQALLKEPLALIGIQNSLFFSSLSTLFVLIFGSWLAYALARKTLPLGKWIDGLLMIPLAIPGLVLAFTYLTSFSNTYLDPFSNPGPLLVIAYGIRRLPYMVRSTAAGLAQIPVELEEAAALHGASKLQLITQITLPMIYASLLAGAIMCFSYSMLDVSDSLILAMKDHSYPLMKALYSLYLEPGRGEMMASALGVVAMGILGTCLFFTSLILGQKLNSIFR